MEKIIRIDSLTYRRFLGPRWLLTLLLCIVQLSLFAQNHKVTGTVTDPYGIKLPGVNILIKGTNIGGVTDINGEYNLEANADDTLIFSFMGFVPQEIKINGQININVILEEYTEMLNEVVIVGYGVQKKRDVTGSISSINVEEIQKVHSASINSLIQGRAAGVAVVSNGGSPGAGSNISIRGVGSINGDDPLWIVDGVPTYGDVNPLDIESIEILKDASATAIYGTKGAGGVILVTTKKGRSGKVNVTYESKTGLSQMANKLDLMGASDWAFLRSEAYRNADQPVPANLNGITGEGTDWQDEVTRTALNTNNFISFSGGTDDISNYMSINHNTEEGIVKKSDNTNTAFRLNTTAQVTDWLKVGENFSFSSNTNHFVNEDDEWNAILIQAVAIDPITSVYNEAGGWEGSDYNTIDNPVAHLDRTYDETKTMSGGGNAFLEIDFLKDFKFTSRFGYEFSADNFYDFEPTFFVKTGEENTQSSITRSYSESRNWVISNFLTWNKEIGIHDVKIMGGHEAESIYAEWFGVSATDLISEEKHLRYIDNASGNNEASTYGSALKITWTSYFGRINYSYADRYLLTVNIRYQGSSLFGPDYRYGTFPSASLGWKVSEESFFNIDMINYLKLRISYGKTGSDQALSPYSYYSISRSGQRYVVGGSIVDGVTFPTIANSELHWEEQVSQNIGLDLAFFNNQLTFSGDYYIAKTDDMIYDPSIQGHVGSQENPFTNLTSLENKGFELELGYKNNFRELKYKVNLTFSHVKNEILSLNTAEGIFAAEFMTLNRTYTTTGSPLASFYGYTTDGIFQNQAEIDAHVDENGNPLQNNVQPGDIRYADADGDGVLDEGIIGNPFPDFTGGLNINLDYKGFEFLIFLHGVYGNDILNMNKYFTHNSSMRYNASTEMDGRWLVEGDTDDPNMCRLNVNDVNNMQRSDRFIEDGSYLRVKNVQLAYNISSKLLSRLSLNSLAIFVGAENLYTLTKYTGYDPEIGLYHGDPLDRGIDRLTYPNPRTYYLGVNVKF